MTPRADVLDTLLGPLQRANLDAGMERALSYLGFLQEETTTDKGTAWSAEGHEPFLPIIASISEVVRKGIPNRVFALLKAEQIGATHSVGLGLALYLASECALNVGYFLPDEKVVKRVFSTRVRQLIRRSVTLAQRMKDREGTNQTLIKDFGEAVLYGLPLSTLTSVISTPLDVRIYDEAGILPEENKDWSEGRTSHSDLNLEVMLGAGYNPDEGIAKAYEDGTQHRWLVNCAKCKLKHICLEDEFIRTEGTMIVLLEGQHTLVCPGCAAPLDVVKHGRFVAAQPKAPITSWRISQLAVRAMDLERIKNRYEKSRRKKSKFARFKTANLALPDAGNLQPFDEPMTNKMQSGEVKLLRRDRSVLPRFCGMDMGDMCHFVAYERLPNGRPHLVQAAELDIKDVADKGKAWQLFQDVGGHSWVIDKLPQTHISRAQALRSPHNVRLMDFPNGSVLHEVKEDHLGAEYLCLKADRDSILDEMCDEFTDEDHFLRIPDAESDPMVALFIKHLRNLKKTEERDRKDRPVYKFRKGVENHFGLALLYAWLAEQYASPFREFEFHSVTDEASEERRDMRTRTT
jgi:hypothetical protein